MYKKGTFLHKEDTILIERHILFQKEHICTLFKKNILNWIVKNPLEFSDIF